MRCAQVCPQATKEAEHRERLSELKLRIEQGKDVVADELDRIANARQHREEAAQCALPPFLFEPRPIHLCIKIFTLKCTS